MERSRLAGLSLLLLLHLVKNLTPLPSVNIVARLFNAPLHDADAEALGVSTVGSSEAIILAVLAAKRRWQNARRLAGKSTEKPNIVMNAAVQGASSWHPRCWPVLTLYLRVQSAGKRPPGTSKLRSATGTAHRTSTSLTPPRLSPSSTKTPSSSVLSLGEFSSALHPGTASEYCLLQNHLHWP